MNIEFYIAKDEVIPTRLRLKVDFNEHIKGIDVYYNKCKDGFAYEFIFFDKDNVTEEIMLEIVKKIAKKMSWQADDHGAYLEIASIKQTDSDHERYYKACYRVDFRMHDGY